MCVNKYVTANKFYEYKWKLEYIISYKARGELTLKWTFMKWNKKKNISTLFIEGDYLTTFIFMEKKNFDYDF